MDTNDFIKVLRDSKEQLNKSIDECQNGPSELALFASKMVPLLADFSAIEAELFPTTSELATGEPSVSIPASLE